MDINGKYPLGLGDRLMQCPKYGFEITPDLKKSYCVACSESCGSHPRFELGKVDVFKLARLLKERELSKKGVGNAVRH